MMRYARKNTEKLLSYWRAKGENMFKFNVTMNDDDYLEYNKFHMFVSPYGRKSMVRAYILIAVIIAVFALISLFKGGFTLSAFKGIIPLIILLALYLIFYKSILTFFLKGQLKSYKKSGKMGYSPISELSFYEDRFEEITETNKTEQLYSSIERISIVDKKYIYIHVNSIMAYIIPFSSFNSRTEYEEFMEFFKNYLHKY